MIQVQRVDVPNPKGAFTEAEGSQARELALPGDRKGSTSLTLAFLRPLGLSASSSLSIFGTRCAMFAGTSSSLLQGNS